MPASKPSIRRHRLFSPYVRSHNHPAAHPRASARRSPPPPTLETIKRSFPAPSGATRHADLTPLDRVRLSCKNRVAPGDVVAVAKENGTRDLAIIQRLFAATFSPTLSVTYAHVHCLGPSGLGEKGELFLQDRNCRTVRVGALRWVPEAGRRVWRFVAHPGGGVCCDPLPAGKHYPGRDDIGRRDPFVTTSCHGCLVREAKKRTKRVSHSLEGGSVDIGTEKYHTGDGVWFTEPLAEGVRQTVSGRPWAAGIIEGITADSLCVRVMRRLSEVRGGHGLPVSERELYLSSERIEVPFNQVMGKPALNLPGHPHNVSVTTSLPRKAQAVRTLLKPLAIPPLGCDRCRRSQEADTAARQAFRRLRLPSADLYAGGGGSVLGTMTHFQVKYAVDSDGPSCNTLRTNFPGLKVYEEEVERWVRNQAPAHAGQVSMVVAGPPCQGFSGANMHSRPDDHRNTELLTTLGAVAAVQPDIVVIENVPRTLTSQNVPQGDVENYGIAVLNRLLAIGYQVRIGVLDSRAYGSPQARPRLFIVAVRAGLHMPDFPSPTHSTPLPRPTNMPIGGGTHAAQFRIQSPRTEVPGTAPFPAVTAWDAISDLPPWSYREAARAGVGFDKVGFLGPELYATAPKTDFQLGARRGGDGLVRDHFTGRRSERELELIENAPLATQRYSVEGTSRRLGPAEGFFTLLTSSRPGGKSCSPIHWDQDRTFSVAERKRATGFPDTYELVGSAKDADRMTGNAVNVHVARALTEKIKQDVYFEEWNRWGRPSSNEFWRRWRLAHPVSR